MIQSSRFATNDRCVGEKEETGRACLKLKYFLIPKTADNSLLLFYYSFGFIFFFFFLFLFCSFFFNFHTRKHSMLPNLCCFALVITHALFLFPPLTHSHSSFFDLYPISFLFLFISLIFYIFLFFSNILYMLSSLTPSTFFPFLILIHHGSISACVH